MSESELLLFIENNWWLFKICVGLGAGTGAGLATWAGIGWLAKRHPSTQVTTSEKEDK